MTFGLLIGKVLLALVLSLLNVLLITWIERKVLGRVQLRYGPMVTGFHGLLLPIADAAKLIFKEDIVPEEADRLIFWVAPAIVFIPSFVLYMFIPFSPTIMAWPYDMGLFFLLAVAAMFPMGFTLAGWASHNKYSLLGALRAAAQQISYEVPMLLAALGVALLAGSVRFTDIVAAQKNLWFIVTQPLSFLIFAAAVLVELNRTPFDMPEAESELVAGYHVEYGGMKFALFFLTEYSNLFVMSGVAVLLFLGGWNGPFLPPLLWFVIKTYAVVATFSWVRGSLPRMRVDQLMEFSWRVLLPVGLLNLLLTGAVITWRGL